MKRKYLKDLQDEGGRGPFQQVAHAADDKQLKRDTREAILSFMSNDLIVHQSELKPYKAETKKRFIELYRRINYLQDRHYDMFKEMDEKNGNTSAAASPIKPNNCF